tara:strand:+ start:321 stop:542 length:222 start_codon:yes stop_codon:yes gene_type:complete
MIDRFLNKLKYPSEQLEFNRTVSEGFKQVSNTISALGDTLNNIEKRLNKIENDHKIENLLSSHELEWLKNKKG